MDEREVTSVARSARDAASRIDGAEGPKWLDQLDDDHGRIQDALGWFLDNDPDEGLGLAATLHIFWMERGHLTPGRDWLQKFLDRHADRDSTRVRGLNAYGRLAFRQGDNDVARERFTEALELARSIGDREGEGWTLSGLSRVSLRDHDFVTVRERAQASVDIFAELGDREAQWSPLHVLAYVTMMEGDLDKARDLFVQSMELAQEIGREDESAGELQNLGIIEKRLGNLDRALEHFGRGLEMAIERWDTYLLPYLLLGVATVDTARGRYERGAQLIGATDAMLSATEMVLDPGDQPDHDDVVRRLLAELGNDAYAGEHSTGGQLTAEEVAALARSAISG